MTLTAEVIVCTYNGVAFVLEQLQSILRQTRCVDKISIYDDQSSDDTVACIREFVNSLPLNEQRLFNIRVNASNLGYARNFTSAIVQATEDVLFLCDQDDIWEPEKVAILMDMFDEHGPDLAFSDGTLIDSVGRKIGTMTVLESYDLSKDCISAFRENGVELLARRNYINGASMAIRRVSAQRALPLPCDMPHDYWLAIWSSIHAGILATPLALYRYRQHPGNVIGIGTTNLLYLWLSIWRDPNTPRERELRILKAVTDRISSLQDQKKIIAFRRKLEWLSRVVTPDKKNLSRVLAIFQSAMDGSYRRYSSKYGFYRDFVSLLK